MESDPVGLYGGLNTYAYVNGNPIPRGCLMKRSILSKRKVLSWCIASLLGGIFLLAFAHHRHYFEGPTRWPAIGAAVLCWLLISAAVWVAANDRSLDKVDEAFRNKSDDD